MTVSHAVSLQACLDRLKHGDDAARNELLEIASRRLDQLARAMLKGYPGVRRWEQTGDVVQNALIRLDRALRAVTPESPLQFHRLAVLQVRRELIDLARHHFGAEGPGRAHQSNAVAANGSGDSASPPYEAAGVSGEPSRLAAWTEFHQKADGLPEDEREVFDLVWYQGLSYPEAAEVLGVSAKTVMRRYQAARLRLYSAVAGQLPES